MNTNTDIKPSYNVFNRLLKRSKVSKRQFSRDTGIGLTTLNDWRLGISSPKAFKMIIISDYFGVDIRDFFEGDGYEERGKM